jgi:hypothetical protein
MPRLTLVLGCLMVLLTHLQAQTTIKYSYDQAGNRIERKPLVVKSTEIDTAQTNSTVANGGKKGNVSQAYGEAQSHIILYPNPVVHELTLRFDDYTEPPMGQIVVYDLNGRQIMALAINTMQSTISFEHLKAGTYIVRLFMGHQHNEWKVIKE